MAGYRPFHRLVIHEEMSIRSHAKIECRDVRPIMAGGTVSS